MNLDLVKQAGLMLTAAKLTVVVQEVRTCETDAEGGSLQCLSPAAGMWTDMLLAP